MVDVPAQVGEFSAAAVVERVVEAAILQLVEVHAAAGGVDLALVDTVLDAIDSFTLQAAQTVLLGVCKRTEVLSTDSLL